MKRNIVLLGLFVLAGSGCGREASERFGTDRFVHAKEPVPEDGPLIVTAPVRTGGGGRGSSSGPVDYEMATGHGPSMAIRTQMLKIKEENAGSNVLEDVKTAFKDGLSSPLVAVPVEGARALSEWMSSLDTGEYHVSRLRLSRDAKLDRVERAVGNGREKIRRYEISFVDTHFLGWIEVKRSGKSWLIVDAGSYGSFSETR